MGDWVEVQVVFDWDPAHGPRAGGSVAGKAVANLLQLLHMYCCEAISDGPELEIKEWFDKLQEHCPGRLCDLSDELALDQNVTDEDGDPSMKLFHTAWVQTEALLQHLYRLRAAIRSAPLEPKWWYEPDSTDRDLLGLIHSLNLVRNLGGYRVRCVVD